MEQHTLKIVKTDILSNRRVGRLADWQTGWLVGRQSNETGRQTGRLIVRGSNKTGRQTGRLLGKETDQRGRQKGQLVGRETDDRGSQAGWKAERHTRQVGRQLGQAGKQALKEIDKGAYRRLFALYGRDASHPYQNRHLTAFLHTKIDLLRDIKFNFKKLKYTSCPLPRPHVQKIFLKIEN